MNKLFLFSILAALGCSGNAMPLSDDGLERGAICQGSRAWQQANVCGVGNQTGACVRVVEGPLVLTSLKTCEYCPHPIFVTIRESFENPSEQRKPRWEMKSEAMKALVLQNVTVDIKEGESLFVGTEGFNSVVDSSCCYVTWVGFRPSGKKN